MMERARILWKIELFNASNIPDFGYVFFCCRKSYLCGPSESASVCAECLALAIGVLRKYTDREPPSVIHVQQCSGRFSGNEHHYSP